MFSGLLLGVFFQFSVAKRTYVIVPLMVSPMIDAGAPIIPRVKNCWN